MTGRILHSLKLEKHGPALKNRLVGDPSMYKGLFGRESLRSEDGVKYFMDTLRPHLTRGVQSVFLWTFFNVFVQREKTWRLSSGLEKFNIPQASERLLDGHATNEYHE